jgi:uncharacterized protein YqjF (DUF2071 family)
MLHLKDHPFNVETFFDTSLVLTYAIPKNELVKFIPECLTLDTFHDKWAFIAIALVKTRSLRPKGFPEFMGNDFILAGFRVFVRYKTNNGKDLRGLYILKSETNKKKMEFWGNIFTHYNYTTSDIEMTKKDNMIKVYSKRSGLNIKVTKGANIALPEGSPFATWNEARRYAGPLPFTFTYDKKTNEVLIIEGVRENWKPEPVKVLKDKVKFITEKKFKHVTLANAFVIENVPYLWKKGRKEIWKG